MSVTPLVVPICCTNNPISSHPVFPSQSCVRFSMTSSLRIVPEEIACGTTAISTPITAACVCREHCVSALFAHACPLCPNCGATALKRPSFLPASLAPLMCHGQARLFCSHFPSLSFSLSCALSLSLSLSLRFLVFIGWCRSRTTNQFQSLSQ